MPWDPLKDALEPALQMSKRMLRYDAMTEKEAKKSLSVEVFKKIDLSSWRGETCY